MGTRTGCSEQRCAGISPIGCGTAFVPQISRSKPPLVAVPLNPVCFEPPAESLSERIFRGDQSAETEMIVSHSQPMLRVIFPRVRNPHTADDLLHDSLLAALLVLRSRQLKEPDKLANYLLRIARFQTTNYLRCKNAQMITQAEDDLDCLSDDRDPSQAYQQWHQIQLAIRLINSLSVSRDRRIATRFYIEEESKARICSELNLSAANFDRIIYRVKQRLRKLVTSVGSDLHGVERA